MTLLTSIDALDIIFNNLEDVEDIEFFNDIKSNISYTNISYLEPVIDEVIKFYKQNNKFPSFDYLKLISGDLIKSVDKLLDPDVMLTLSNNLREEARLQKAIEALNKKNETLALTILQTKIDEVAVPITGIDTAWDDYQRKKNRPSVGLKTGIPDVDFVFRYITPKSMTGILAPPKNGKTTTAVSIMYHNIMELGNNMAYIILEGDVEEVKFNLISCHSKKLGTPISAFKIKSTELTSEEEEIFKKVAEDFEKNKKGSYAILGVSNFTQITPLQVTKTIKMLKNIWGRLDGVISDYAQLYKYYRVPGVTEEKAVINFWMRYWHDICIVEDFAKIMLSQINREGEEILRKKI